LVMSSSQNVTHGNRRSGFRPLDSGFRARATRDCGIHLEFRASRRSEALASSLLVARVRFGDLLRPEALVGPTEVPNEIQETIHCPAAQRGGSVRSPGVFERA